jgi:two-component system chemotaxis sensor kinase CheA
MSDAKANEQNELLDSLLGDFLDESDQLLTQLNERLLQLDEWVRALDDDGHRPPCDPNLLNEMFRAAHSLKGLSAMLGLADINHLTHKIENVFDAARKNELTVDGDVTELVFKGLDQLTALVDRLKQPGGEPVDSSAVVDAIRRLLQTAGVERAQSSQADAERALSAVTAEKDDSSSAPARDADPLEDVADEDEIPEKYLSIFIDESEAALDGLTGALLAIESRAGGGDLKGLLGTAHKIKGSAASIGLNRIAKLAHLMEDLLEELLESHASLSPGAADVLLRCTDALQRHVGELKQGTARSDHFGQLARDLLAVRSGRSGEEVPGRTTYAGEVKFQPDFPAAGLKAQVIYERLAKLGEVSECDPPPEKLDQIGQLHCFRFRLATDQPLEAVKDRLRIAGVLEASVEPLPCDEPTSVGSAGGRIGNPSGNEADLAERLPIRPTENPTPAQPPPSAAAGLSGGAEGKTAGQATRGAPRETDSPQRPTETVRVDIERLDHLMDLAGQLVINKAQFAQIGDKLRASLACKKSAQALNRVSAELDRMGGQIALRLDGEHSPGVLEAVRSHVRRLQNDLEPLRREVQDFARAHEVVEDLFEAIHQLGRVSDGIQQSVMDTRMVPIGPLFSRFKRVVRDITRSSGKQARLEIRGENTELDKRMIDELGDPLVHLVRNSVDHGIEPPDARQAAGKPPEGTVTLDAFHRGNSIVIEVRDDGKGLDAERILRKCLEKGLLTKAEAEKMTTQQICQKIWEPGLSTAEKVTEVSGRGMGMDIVKSKIEELSGKTDISSVPGQGTTITIKLPLTLAILPSLMVEIRGDVFAIPMEAVVEIVSVARSQLNSVQGRPMASVRGRVVSLLRLGDLLAFHDRRTPRAPREAEASEPRAPREAEPGEPRAEREECHRPSETTLVVVGAAGEEVGLAVDRVLGEEDVVIKSIAENFANVRGIAGASILGDGRVSLILDIAGLVEIVSEKAACSTR